MKALFFATLIALSTATMFTACDKPNYQHPMHRK